MGAISSQKQTRKTSTIVCNFEPFVYISEKLLPRYIQHMRFIVAVDKLLTAS